MKPTIEAGQPLHVFEIDEAGRKTHSAACWCDPKTREAEIASWPVFQEGA